MKDIIKLCLHEFRIQMMSKRVWLGYLVGIVVVMEQVVMYIRYAAYMGEPVNVLEGFILVGNCDRKIMLLSVGWLLIMSEAPYVDRISFYVIYRTKRKIWNRAMLLYTMLQAVLYNGVIVAVVMMTGSVNGYLADIWSVPFIRMVQPGGEAEAFDLDFPSLDYPDTVSVYEGFIQTFCMQVLYVIILGLLVYVVSQMTNRVAGPIAAFVFHFLGYEIMKEGYGFTITYSMLARAIPAFQVGQGALVNLEQSVLIFVLFICILVGISEKAVKYMEFKEATIQEGD